MLDSQEGDGFQNVQVRRKASTRLRTLRHLRSPCPGIDPPTPSNSQVLLMRSFSENNIRASVQGRNGHQVWAWTPYVSRSVAALRKGQGAPHHIFLLIAHGTDVYGIAMLTNRPDESKYGGIEFWPDCFEHSGDGNFEVQWIHECLEPLRRLEHAPALSTLPNGHFLGHRGFEIADALLKCPREPHAQRVRNSAVRAQPTSAASNRNDASHASSSRPLVRDFVDIALQDCQDVVAPDQPALIQPDEAAGVASVIAASWREAAGLQGEVRRDAEESAEAEVQEEHIYVITFTRNPKEFEACLHEGDELEALRFFTESRGHSCHLSEGGSIFVHPEQHAQVRAQIAVGNLRLGPSHVVVAETYKHLVNLAVSNLRSKLNVRAKSADQFTKIPVRSDVVVAAASASEVLVVRNTFLCLSPHAMRMADSVLQSTGDAHTSVHPRQWCLASQNSSS